MQYGLKLETIGWIAVNLAKWRVAEMRKLARAGDLPFRLFCELAFVEATINLRKQLGLPPYKNGQLTGRQIAALAARSKLLHNLPTRILSPENN